MQKSNIRHLSEHRDYALFSPNIRSEIQRNITPFTDKPAETVNTVEHVISSAIVAFVRKLATSWANKCVNAMERQVNG